MATRTRTAQTLVATVAGVAGVFVLAAGCSSSTRRTTSPTSTAAPAPAAGSSSTSSSTATAARTSTCGAAGTSPNPTGPEASPPGDIPDNQAYATYQGPAGGYTIQVPEGWARTEQGTVASFTDKFNSARIEVVPAASAPTTATAQAELASLASKATCFQAGKITTASRRAGSAVVITYRADSPPNSVTGKVVHQDVERYEFWRGGTEAVITLASPQGSDNVDPWRKVTDTFTWTP